MAMYLVVFRNRKRADIDGPAYDADAARMHDLAQRQPGFLAFKSYAADDGEVVAISEWVDEAAARAWRRVADHAAMQDKGRRVYYESYSLFAGTPNRVHHFRQGD
ncbi:antibiotic biosynthesis monooxygenase [Novosphingobium sp. FSW06-99]|uniref:antibiotic biosynthesis monooxygenase family protein n=1 Tax=Novosphingobium sp. FSW06-99 TaxID=1739113 RepID=UPI003512C771